GQRRSYPKSFKAQIVEECTQPGASVAGVALSHGLNANLVHKWSKRLANTPPRSLLLAAWCPPVFGGHHFKPLAEDLPCQANAAP
ncbi:transposase, partial [Pseudomonas aeruginosa]